jgi:hypothetical protein
MKLASSQEEGYVPAAEMPIKKLEFTPHKNAANVQSVAASSKTPAVNGTSSSLPKIGESLSEESIPTGGSVVEPIKVFLRLRPLPSDYSGEGSITVVDDNTVGLSNVALAKDDSDRFLDKADQDKYKFSRVFGPDTRQITVHEETTAPLVNGLFQGQNGLVFAYGPTNSGKTFTIQGGKDESAGLLPRTLEALYGTIAERSKRESLNEDWTVWVTYMEIYNENVYDLLEQPPDKMKGESRKVFCQTRVLSIHF